MLPHALLALDPDAAFADVPPEGADDASSAGSDGVWERGDAGPGGQAAVEAGLRAVLRASGQAADADLPSGFPDDPWSVDELQARQAASAGEFIGHRFRRRRRVWELPALPARRLGL
jgi:hypothetical protein